MSLVLRCISSYCVFLVFCDVGRSIVPFKKCKFFVELKITALFASILGHTLWPLWSHNRVVQAVSDSEILAVSSSALLSVHIQFVFTLNRPIGQSGQSEK